MATLNQIADEIGDSLGRAFDWMFKERIKVIFRHEAATMVRQAIDKDGLTDHFKTKFNATISIVDDSGLPCGSECGAIRTGKLADPVRYKTDEPFSWVGKSDGTVIYIYTKLAELPYADLTEVYQNNPIRYVYQNGYIYIKNGGICGTITAVTDYSATVSGTVLVTSSDHNLKTGFKIVVSSTTSYDGTFIITKVSDDTFYYTDTYVADETSGDWDRSLVDTCISIEGAYPIGDVLADTTESQLNSTILTNDTELPIPEDLIQGIKLKLLEGELSSIDSKDKIQPEHIDN